MISVLFHWLKPLTKQTNKNQGRKLEIPEKRTAYDELQKRPLTKVHMLTFMNVSSYTSHVTSYVTQSDSHVKTYAPNLNSSTSCHTRLTPRLTSHNQVHMQQFMPRTCTPPRLVADVSRHSRLTTHSQVHTLQFMPRNCNSSTSCRRRLTSLTSYVTQPDSHVKVHVPNLHSSSSCHRRLTSGLTSQSQVHMLKFMSRTCTSASLVTDVSRQVLRHTARFTC